MGTHLQSHIMSWDAYVSDQLVAKGNTTYGAILGHDGSIWAKSGTFDLTESVAAANLFTDNYVCDPCRDQVPGPPEEPRRGGPLHPDQEEGWWSRSCQDRPDRHHWRVRG